MRKIIVMFERLIEMDRLIKCKKTGKPEEFALKLGVSKSCLYRYLRKLRALGVIINYNKYLKSFEYSGRYELIIQQPFRAINKKQRKPEKIESQRSD